MKTKTWRAPAPITLCRRYARTQSAVSNETGGNIDGDRRFLRPRGLYYCDGVRFDYARGLCRGNDFSGQARSGYRPWHQRGCGAGERRMALSRYRVVFFTGITNSPVFKFYVMALP